MGMIEMTIQTRMSESLKYSSQEGLIVDSSQKKPLIILVIQLIQYTALCELEMEIHHKVILLISIMHRNLKNKYRDK